MTLVLSDAQLADIARALAVINAEYHGYGTITIVIKRGQVQAVGLVVEHQYRLEEREKSCSSMQTL